MLGISLSASAGQAGGGWHYTSFGVYHADRTSGRVEHGCAGEHERGCGGRAIAGLERRRRAADGVA